MSLRHVEQLADVDECFSVPSKHVFYAFHLIFDILDVLVVLLYLSLKHYLLYLSQCFQVVLVNQTFDVLRPRLQNFAFDQLAQSLLF